MSALGGLWGRLRNRVGNPLNWSPVDKSLLVAAGYTYVALNSAVTNAIRLRGDRIEPYISRTHLEFGVESFLVLAAFSGILCVIGLALRKRAPHARWYVHLTIQSYCIATAIISYAMGPMTNPWGALFLVASGTAGLIIFDRAVALWGLGTYLTILTGTTLAERLGYIPYAPIFSAPPYIDGRLSNAWVFLMGGGTLAISAAFLLLLDYIIARQREDQEIRRKLAAVGEATARIAHQTRHQLGIIAMSAHVIEKHVQGLAPEDAERVQRELRQLLSVQQELTEMLRDDLTNPVPQGERVRPALGYVELLSDQLDRLRPLASAREIELSLELDENVPLEAAPLEAEKFAQGLFNVIENAISAARTRIDLSVRPASSGELEIAVRDDGEGIPAEILGRVTEPFFTTKAEGSGMGLAIAAAAAAMQGGRLKVENHPRGGLLVRFLVPAPPAA